MYYKMPPPQYYLGARWYCDFKTPTKDIIKSWWKEPSKFRKKVGGIY